MIRQPILSASQDCSCSIKSLATIVIPLCLIGVTTTSQVKLAISQSELSGLNAMLRLNKHYQSLLADELS